MFGQVKGWSSKVSQKHYHCRVKKGYTPQKKYENEVIEMHQQSPQTHRPLLQGLCQAPPANENTQATMELLGFS